ncbi:T6SS immunity protein Tli3 family protein [Buttiauxella agrestis]|uniref:Tli3-like domain-containing protein n=1 Tax=Buttiauxella agrestis ATCC 33320 TaxID=1006004 RepID=A0A085GIC2_9ENTR|nr:hypothetical protein [Buttiauxella agrestis]KFC83467.1 hypothetical protein GBAG_0906 [Buttiauxella agrestis ATCC 33320]
MKPIKNTLLFVGIVLLTACHAKPKPPPTQVVYRFDDHRYLELTGYHCEGGLRYIDTERNIQHQIYDVSDGYRIFTKTFIHPSERYIAITSYEGGGFAISKDYGKSWDGASYSPGGGAIKYGASYPIREEIESFTVVNDQGFMLTKKGELYLSSKPFDDPRLEPGGSGIEYTITTGKGKTQKELIRPGEGGGAWGENYLSWNSILGPDSWTIYAYRSNFQNIPNKVPKVKNYKGWDHMRCNPDLGLEKQQ